eukprot:6436874-Amphidinium_carterae.1
MFAPPRFISGQATACATTKSKSPPQGKRHNGIIPSCSAHGWGTMGQSWLAAWSLWAMVASFLFNWSRDRRWMRHP